VTYPPLRQFRKKLRGAIEDAYTALFLIAAGLLMFLVVGFLFVWLPIFGWS
jgi:hypothetical protein